MKIVTRGIAALLVSISATLAFAQTGSSGLSKKNEDTAAKSRVNRPPLDTASFDVGIYEMRAGTEKGLPHFLGEARIVPAQVGTVFGFIFQLTGFTGTRLVPIRSVTKHPAFIPKGATEPRTQHEEKTFFKPINGVMKWPYLYRFDSKEELVPGEWSLAVRAL